MERWDLYDAERNIIGEHIRGRQMPENGYHLVVHVWIQNSDGKFLMTQRSADKASYPLKWECVGGAVIQGESSLQGALRETEEEVGLRFLEEEAVLLLTKQRGSEGAKRYNDIVDVWLFRYDGGICLEKAKTNEVAQARWMDREEIVKLREENQLVSSIKDLSYFFDGAFE